MEDTVDEILEVSKSEITIRKMKIVVPVATSIYNQATLAEIEAVAASDMKFDVENITQGTQFIESRWAEYEDTAGIWSLSAKADSEGYSGIISDCLGEPGVSMIRELIRTPLVGGFDLPSTTSNLIADKYTIVSVVTSVIPMIAELARDLCTDQNLTSVRVVGIPVNELKDLAKLEAALIEQGYEAVTTEGATAMLMGCTGMLGVRETVEQGLNAKLSQNYPGKYPPVPVIDPAQVAATLLEAMARMGITQSQITYQYPPGKTGLQFDSPMHF